ERVNFALPSDSASLVGTVTDAQTGGPIAGASVQVFVVNTTIPVKSTLTDYKGRYKISGLSEGIYIVVFSTKGFTNKTVSITLASSETKILDIILIPKLTTITGVVCDVKTGLRLPNILIKVFNIHGEFITSILTDVNGQYSICKLPAGTFNVKASSRSFLPKSKIIALAPEATEVADFALVRKQILPPEIIINPQQKNTVHEMLHQMLTMRSHVSLKSTLTWIKNSQNIKILLTDNQSANSLQLSLHLAIALILDTIINTADIDNSVIQESIQQSIVKTNKQSIVVDNSRDITIITNITNDTDLTTNIQLLLQVLVALLVQIDIL
ncbi:carboxypeptidase-like regulatory domain-containing protein, partial [Priestia megaterium]|uniref:carboxypeptidase-like regulatory domain-containing protein n=1 Tax=Priestia megaterium TaxID=1404 RepID=UPI002A6B4408